VHLLAVRLRQLALGVPELDRLGVRERDPEARCEFLGEDPTANRKHPGGFDAAVAHEGDVRSATTDVDEDAPGIVDLVGRRATRHRVRLGHGCHQLQVQLRGDGLKGADVRQRREGVEDGDDHLLSLESERIADGEPVDAGRWSRRS